MATLEAHDVFVSYSRKDIAFAKVLHDTMKERGLDTWIDWEDIPPTADWLAEVYRAIESAHTFVFVVSQTSVHSEVCRRELEHAIEHHKRIVPITVHDVDAGVVPPEIASLNWIFFREEDDFQRAFDTLLEAIRTDLDWVRTHTRLLQRAIEWEGHSRDASFLMRGSELASALEAIADAGTGKEPRLTALQVEYVQESRRHEAEQERRWKRRNQAIRALIGGALAVSIGLTLWALANEREARRQQTYSRSNELAALARMTLEQDPALSYRLAQAAVEAHQGAMAESALWVPLKDPFTTHVLAGHAAQVANAILSPDERTIATASWDGTVRLWDFGTGMQLRVLQSPEGHSVRTVDSLAFSPDGSKLVSMTRYAGVTGGDIACVWDVATGKLAYTLAHDDLCDAGPAVSPAGAYIVPLPPGGWKPGRYDVPVHDLGTGKQVMSLVGHADVVDVAVFSPDGRLLATDSTEEAVARIWDMRSGKVVHKLPGQTGFSRHIAWSPDGRLLAITSVAGLARVYDAGSGTLVHEYKLPGAKFALFSPDGRHLAVKAEPNRIALIDLHAKAIANELEASFVGTRDVAFSPDGSRIAFAVDGGRVEIRAVDDGELEYALKGHSLLVNSVAFTKDGSSALTASKDGTARLWELKAGQEIAVVKPGSDGKTVDSQAISAVSGNGRFALLGSGTRRCEVWDLAAPRRLWAFEGKPGEVRTAWFSRDGTRLCIATSDGPATIRDSLTGTVVCQILEQDRQLACADFSPDGERLVTASYDGTATVWDASTGLEIRRLVHRPDGDVTDAEFSPDGTLIVTAIDTRAHVWETATGRLLFKLRHNHEIHHAIFTPDGRSVITMHLLRSPITIWNATTGEEQCRLDASTFLGVSEDGLLMATLDKNGVMRARAIPSGRPVQEFPVAAPPTSAKFSRDGSTLVAGSIDSVVRVWDASSGEQVRALVGHRGSVWGVAFVRGVDRFVTWSEDGTVRIWPASTQEMLRLMRDGFRSPRALLEEEKREYGLEREP